MVAIVGYQINRKLLPFLGQKSCCLLSKLCVLSENHHILKVPNIINSQNFWHCSKKMSSNISHSIRSLRTLLMTPTLPCICENYFKDTTSSMLRSCLTYFDSPRKIKKNNFCNVFPTWLEAKWFSLHEQVTTKVQSLQSHEQLNDNHVSWRIFRVRYTSKVYLLLKRNFRHKRINVSICYYIPPTSSSFAGY